MLLARASGGAAPPCPPESNEAPHLRHVVLLRAQVLLLLLLHEELLLLAPPGRAQLLKASLHLLQDFGGVADHQLHAVLGRLQELHRLLVVLSFDALEGDGQERNYRTDLFLGGSFRVFTHHAVDGQQLVPSLQAAVALRHASRDDAGDIDGRVLLFAPHHVESQSLLRLRKLHHPRVGVAFAGCEGGNCGLKGRELALAQRSNFPKPSKTYPVFYKNCKSRNPSWNNR